MSHIRAGDEHLHYGDSSHRWVAQSDIDQHVWEDALRSHLADHLLTMGGYERERKRERAAKAAVPRQR